MAIRIRFQYATLSSLGYSIERLSDAKLFDFSDSTFKTTPTTAIASLPEDTGNFLGRYKVTLASTPIGQFTDGDYCVTIHNTGSGNVAVSELGLTMINGDDVTTALWSLLSPLIVAGKFTSTSLSNCLEAVLTTEPTVVGDGAMSTWNFRKLLRWGVMRLGKASKTPTVLNVQTLAGVTSTSQSVTDDNNGNESTGVPG